MIIQLYRDMDFINVHIARAGHFLYCTESYLKMVVYNKIKYNYSVLTTTTPNELTGVCYALGGCDG